jgi:peptide/nickel transport system permease protein
MSVEAFTPSPVAWRRFLGRRLTLVIGAGILLFFLLLAIAAPLVAPFDPVSGYGTTVGTIAGFFGGIVDAVFMRLVDIILAFPFLVLMLSIIAILGPGLSSFYIAMALVGWVSYARLIRAQMLVLKSSDYAVAAVSLGFSRFRIMFRHLLPNAIAGSIVFSMSDATLVLLSGAAVSYLGLGVQPPLAEWGVMVAEGQSFITTAWWITLFPGLSIVCLAFGFSMLGDALGELLGVHE